MSDHPWLDDVPAYVLDALAAEDRRVFEAHLEECGRCRKAVREYRETATRLSEALPEVAPPAALRERVLAAAAAESAREGPAGSSAAPSGGPTPLRGTGRSGGHGPRTGGEIRHRSPIAPWLVAAAAAVVAAWAGFWALGRGAERDALEEELADARARIAELGEEAARRDSMLAALVGPGVQTATLTATPGEPRVRLFLNAATRQLLVTAFDLPPAPAGRTYQLWGLAPGRDPVSLGTFDTGPDGSAVLLRTAPAEGFARSAVSEEPAGGSPQPTAAPFLLGPFSAGP